MISSMRSARTRSDLSIRVVVATVGAFIATREAPAQDTWSLRSPQGRPVPRLSAAVAFDSAHQQAVLFGAVNGSTENGET